MDMPTTRISARQEERWKHGRSATAGRLAESRLSGNASYRPFRAIRLSRCVLLAITAYFCCSFALSAQTSDSQSEEENKSWTATTDSNSENAERIRTTESHTHSGNRTLNKQSVERRSSDGGFVPYQDIEKETVQVDAATVRTTTRTFAHDADGGRTLVEVVEEEKQTLAGGDSNVVRSTSDPNVNGDPCVPAIDEIEAAPVHVQAGIAQGYETIQIDQMPHQFRMCEHHDFFGLRELTVLGQDQQATEGSEEVALSSGPQERRGHPLAHDISNDHIQGLIRVPQKGIEIAVDSLGGDRQRGHSKSGKVQGRLIEQQGLLDSEADLDLPFPGLFQFLVRCLELGGSCNDALLQAGVEGSYFGFCALALRNVHTKRDRKSTDKHRSQNTAKKNEHVRLTVDLSSGLVPLPQKLDFGVLDIFERGASVAEARSYRSLRQRCFCRKRFGAP